MDILDEIRTCPKSWIDELLLDQRHKQHFIDVYCSKCKYHSIVFTDNNEFHICNDVWSGENAVGKHILYSETIDICIECDGFKRKE